MSNYSLIMPQNQETKIDCVYGRKTYLDFPEGIVTRKAAQSACKRVEEILGRIIFENQPLIDQISPVGMTLELASETEGRRAILSANFRNERLYIFAPESVLRETTNKGQVDLVLIQSLSAGVANIGFYSLLQGKTSQAYSNQELDATMAKLITATGTLLRQFQSGIKAEILRSGEVIIK